MNPDKYNRSISLMCPTCGSSDFRYDDEVDISEQIFTCASCDRELTRDELEQENAENIEEHFKDIQKQVTEDLKKDISKIFSKNKSFRLK
jgi:uncharacterized Zn finger protein (UPF0148 family)